MQNTITGALTNSGWGKKGRNPSTSGSQSLCQRALRTQFDGNIARQILLFQRLVVTQIRQDKSIDLAGVRERRQSTFPRGAGIIRNRH